MFRKLVIATALSVLILCNIFCASYTLADEYVEKKFGNYGYIVLENNTIELTKYYGNETNVSVPKAIDGKSVVSVGERAFSFCESLKTITIPDSVVSIGNRAFNGCHALSSITLPGSLTSIGNLAFSYCYSLANIIIPDSVTSIGDDVFNACISLKNIVLPDNVTSVGANPFEKCDSLTAITVSPDHPVLATINNNLYNKQTKTIITCLATSTQSAFEIPQGILEIGESAFEGCRAIKSIVIPDSVISIKRCAFFECESLESISIPSSITIIPDRVFYGCRSLTNISIPESVTSIGEMAFDSCISLKSITIPSSVVEIGNNALPKYAQDLIVTVQNNSYAKQYCIDNGIAYTYPDSLDWLNDQ